MGGVGEHHDRADGQTDHDLHDGEPDVERGGEREPTARHWSSPCWWHVVLVICVIAVIGVPR